MKRTIQYITLTQDFLHQIVKSTANLPEDSIFLSTDVNTDSGDIEVLIGSDTFPEVPEGQQYPQFKLIGTFSDTSKKPKPKK